MSESEPNGVSRRAEMFRLNISLVVTVVAADLITTRANLDLIIKSINPESLLRQKFRVEL